MFDEPTTVQNDTLNVEDSSQSEGLFDDIVEEEETPQSETETEEVTETPTEVGEDEKEDDSPFLEIKFNHETRHLTRDEAVSLAQKGMNYDRFYGSIENLAKLNGMSVGEYMQSLQDTQVRFEVNKEVRELQKKYPNSDKGALTELATTRVRERLLNQEYEEERQSAQADVQLRDEMERQLTVFEKHYPNVDTDHLDKEVFTLMADGYTLLEAYSLWKGKQENSQRKSNEAKQKISQKNEENKKRSMGNTSNSGSVDYDDFLSGFFNA